MYLYFMDLRPSSVKKPVWHVKSTDVVKQNATQFVDSKLQWQAGMVKQVSIVFYEKNGNDLLVNISPLQFTIVTALNETIKGTFMMTFNLTIGAAQKYISSKIHYNSVDSFEILGATKLSDSRTVSLVNPEMLASCHTITSVFRFARVTNRIDLRLRLLAAVDSDSSYWNNPQAWEAVEDRSVTASLMLQEVKGDGWFDMESESDASSLSSFEELELA